MEELKRNRKAFRTSATKILRNIEEIKQKEDCQEKLIAVKQQLKSKTEILKTIDEEILKSISDPNVDVTTEIEEADTYQQNLIEGILKIDSFLEKKNKVRYDKRFLESPFKEGDIVMVENFVYPNTRKLTAPFDGPYKILRKISNVTFEINKPNALTKRKTDIVHSTRLRFFNSADKFELTQRP